MDPLRKHSLCPRAGMSQFEPQSAGLGPNGKLGSMYGGMYTFAFFTNLQ